MTKAAKKPRKPSGSGLARIAPTAEALQSLIEWAAGMAQTIAKRYGFLSRSQEELELESEAVLTLVRQAQRFDFNRVPRDGNAVGLFRGFSALSIRSECVREARRLRNGGTYHTREERSGESLVVTPFSDLAKGVSYSEKLFGSAVFDPPDTATTPEPDVPEPPSPRPASDDLPIAQQAVDTLNVAVRAIFAGPMGRDLVRVSRVRKEDFLRLIKKVQDSLAELASEQT